MRTHFLSERERQGTRAFYESAFPEDSERFVDFYYDWVVKRNDVFVADQWEGGGYQVQAMVHINRHRFSINGKTEHAPYFVAVATRSDCRRQGKMRRLIERALQDMDRRQYAFAFLMPANPDYYTGLGFRYFPNQPGLWQLKPCQGKGFAHGEEQSREMAWRKAGAEDIGRMCAFANQVQEQRFQISILWDEDYCRRLFAETAAEDGGVLLLETHNGLQGILVYGISLDGEKTAEIKDFILQEGLMADLQSQLGASVQAALPGCAIAFPSMEMMVRIVSIFRFVPLIRSREERTLYVDVEDSIIPSNCGCFRIVLGPEGSRIDRIHRTGREQKAGIAKLAQVLLADVPVSIQEWV